MVVSDLYVSYNFCLWADIGPATAGRLKHDYRARHIYHITLLKRAEVPDFGSLAGDWRLHSGTRGSSYVSASLSARR